MEVLNNNDIYRLANIFPNLKDALILLRNKIKADREKMKDDYEIAVHFRAIISLPDSKLTGLLEEDNVFINKAYIGKLLGENMVLDIVKTDNPQSLSSEYIKVSELKVFSETTIEKFIEKKKHLNEINDTIAYINSLENKILAVHEFLLNENKS